MKYFLYCRKSSEAEDRQVMSIESQRSELLRVLRAVPGDEVIEIIEESRSAMTPGRPKFESMMARIEAGEADGIATWAPDRLARNSIDGGRIVYLLDRGVLRDLKFATYTFENNPQGKFMLQIMFGQSKYYSDALSENVKRGNRTKLENGWRPNRAPLGYRNDLRAKTVEIDPIYFPLVQRLFRLVATTGCTAQEAARIARDVWGFTTPPSNRKPGAPLPFSTAHRILTDRFYTGVIVWNGRTYPGRHAPAVSVENFERVQHRLRRPDAPRPQSRTFAYRGLIRCGACGLTVTAEHKQNRQGHRYVYYHCSRRKAGEPCREPAVEVRALERQIAAFLATLAVEPQVHARVLADLDRKEANAGSIVEARVRDLQQALRETKRQSEALVPLRLSGAITEEEFTAQRMRLAHQAANQEQDLQQVQSGRDMFEPARDLLAFSKYAPVWFSEAAEHEKGDFVKLVGSNPTLKGKILSIYAAPPFVELAKLAASPSLLGEREEVLTLRHKQEQSVVVGELLRSIDEMPKRNEWTNLLREVCGRNEVPQVPQVPKPPRLAA